MSLTADSEFEDNVFRIHYFIKQGYLNDLKAFLDKFSFEEQRKMINCNKCKNTDYAPALFSAVRYHHVENCGCELIWNEPLDIYNKNGDYNIKKCEKIFKSSNKKEIILLLLEKGANPNITLGTNDVLFDYKTSLSEHAKSTKLLYSDPIPKLFFLLTYLKIINN